MTVSVEEMTAAMGRMLAFLGDESEAADENGRREIRTLTAARDYILRMTAENAEMRKRAELRRAIFDDALEQLKSEPVHLVLFTANIKLRERLAIVQRDHPDIARELGLEVERG